MIKTRSIAAIGACSLLLAACAGNPAPSTSVATSAQEKALVDRVRQLTETTCNFEPTLTTIAAVGADVAAHYYAPAAGAPGIVAAAKRIADAVCAPINARSFVVGRNLVTRDGVQLHGRFVRSNRRI